MIVVAAITIHKIFRSDLILKAKAKASTTSTARSIINKS